ncbi:MAG: hypothetical protein AAF488_00195, partial [Planctomycetota bacterium]
MSPRLLVMFVVLLGLTPIATAAPRQPTEATESSPAAEEATPALEEKGVPHETLRALLDSIQARTADLQAAKEARDALADPTERTDATTEIRRLEAEISELQSKFESIVTGVDPRSLREVEPVRFDLKNEITTLLEPVVRQLKEATAEPRQIEQLRNDLQLQERRIGMATRALDNLRL